MPRYFFHVRDGRSIPDREGTELPDIYTAQTQAVHMAGEILRELGASLWDGDEWTLEVSDERGRGLFVIRFSAEETLTPPGAPPGTRPGDAGPS